MIPKTGLNKFRSACADEVSNGQAGTGTNTPASSDTALQTPVVATKLSASVTEGATAFQTSHVIPSTVSTGTSFTEWAVLAADDTLLSIALTASISHTANDEITKLTTFNVVDR